MRSFEQRTDRVEQTRSALLAAGGGLTVQFPARSLTTISFRLVVLNNIGEGQPEVHNEYASNQFLHTRGLPVAGDRARAGDILQRLADASKPFETMIETRGETATVTATGK